MTLTGEKLQRSLRLFVAGVHLVLTFSLHMSACGSSNALLEAYSTEGLDAPDHLGVHELRTLAGSGSLGLGGVHQRH